MGAIGTPLVRKALKLHRGDIYELAYALHAPPVTVWRWVARGVNPRREYRDALENLIKKNGK